MFQGTAFDKEQTVNDAAIVQFFIKTPIAENRAISITSGRPRFDFGLYLI